MTDNQRMFLQLLVLSVVALVHMSNACPPGCSCNTQYASVVCNGLTKLPATDIPANLRWFECQDCQLGDLSADDVVAFSHAKMLKLENAGVTTFAPGTFASFANLEKAYLNGNLIKELQANTFVGMSEVVQLRLENNQIEKIHVGAFKGLTRVNDLGLTHNKLVHVDGDVFKDIQHVTRLMLYSNQLKLAPKMFQYLPNVGYLNLNYNNITSIPPLSFWGMKGLGSLAIQGNPLLTSIEDGAFEGAELMSSLLLNYNSINYVDINAFRKLTKMVTLHLDDNQLTVVEPAMLNFMPKLQSLYINNNLLTTPPTGLNLPVMEWYVAGNNQFTEIPEDMGFVNAPILRTAYWNGCRIKHVSSLHFNKFPKLNNIWLHKNLITTLDETDLKQAFSKLTHLSLHSNPLNCDCKLAWVKKLKVFWKGANKMRCATPHTKLFLKTTDADLMCKTK